MASDGAKASAMGGFPNLLDKYQKEYVQLRADFEIIMRDDPGLKDLAEIILQPPSEFRQHNQLLNSVLDCYIVKEVEERKKEVLDVKIRMLARGVYYLLTGVYGSDFDIISCDLASAVRKVRTERKDGQKRLKQMEERLKQMEEKMNKSEG